MYKSLLLFLSLYWFGVLSDSYDIEDDKKGSKGTNKGGRGSKGTNKKGGKKGSKGSNKGATTVAPLTTSSPATTSSPLTTSKAITTIAAINECGDISDISFGTYFADNDIGGCGIEACDARYNYADATACRAACLSNINCQTYTWAPISGDINHAGVSVCSLYTGDEPNGNWGPEQFFCKPEILTCPSGYTQIGNLNTNNDISGCGLQDCAARYAISDIDGCKSSCESNSNCVAFSWAPSYGDQNHAEKVCTLYDSAVPNQNWGPRQIFCAPTTLVACADSSDIAFGTSYADNDIGGCGIEACDARYNYADATACRAACLSNINCQTYSWAPTNGDINHAGVSVCSLYSGDEPNGNWGPEQYFCKPEILSCPSGTSQIGTLNTNNDISGCGLQDCAARYAITDIDGCKSSCEQDTNCVAFSWAPAYGDQNHAEKVCTKYDSFVPNQNWGPRQVFCALPAVLPYDNEEEEEESAFNINLLSSMSSSSSQLAMVSFIVMTVLFALWMCSNNNNENGYKKLKSTQYGSTPDILVVQ